ncbi:MAG: nuclear transport factor 2 family protein [Candidatus Baltobacteraceae bacterium]
MQTTFDRKAAALRYIAAAGDKEYGVLDGLLADDVTFKGPFAALQSKPAFIEALRRMAPVWERSEIRAAFADDGQACVLYDFVTNTQAGSVPCFELIAFNGERIQSVELFFDRSAFAPAAAALAERAAR